MEANVYIGINLNWDYVNRTVTLSMPKYVRKALHKFQQILMGDKEYSPCICAQFQYGQKIQYADPLDLFEYFSYKETNLIQPCFGSFLYYEIAINNTIITDLSNISLEQSKATKHTVKQVAKLLNSLASN